MIYEVRVMDQSMNIKKVISTRELGKRFWNNFYKKEGERTLTSGDSENVPPRIKKALQAKYPELYDSSLM